MASVQAVNRAAYQSLGLNFSKRYIKIITDVDVVDLKRDTSGDEFVVGGMRYKITSESSWFVQDGWISCIAIEVGMGVPP